LVITEVRNKNFGLVTERRLYNGQFYFASLGVVSHAFSAHARTMRVFDVRASSSPPSLPLCQISFLSHPRLLS